MGNLVPHSSRITLRNPEKRRDLLRPETAAERPYGARLPRSEAPLKGLRTAEVGGSNPLTLHSQVSCSAVSATPRVASRRVVVGSGGRVVQEGDHLRLIGLRVEVPALDVSRPGAAHELDLGD